MSYMEIRDGAGTQYYLRTGNTGSSTDPFIMSHLPFALSSEYISGFSTNMGTSTGHTVIAAQSTNIKIFLTQISAYNASTEIATWVDIFDGTSSGTLKFNGYVPALGRLEVSYPIPIAGSANTAVTARCESTSAVVRVNVSGFIGR